MITIEAKQLIALATVTSNDDWRDALKCVCLRRKDHYVEAIATDSFSLARFVHVEEEGEEEEILIPKEVIKNLKAKFSAFVDETEFNGLVMPMRA